MTEPPAPNHSPLTGDDLRQRFQDLQDYVTQLLCNERLVIQARIKLDQQVDFYKGLQRFNHAALRSHSVTEFTTLVAEILIELFEVEIAATQVSTKSGGALIVAGLSSEDPLTTDLKRKLPLLFASLPQGRPTPLDQKTISKLGSDLLDNAMVISIAVEPHIKLMMLAANSKHGAQFHSTIHDEKVDAFAVYADLAASHLGNLYHRVSISESERQLSAMFANASVGMSLAWVESGRFARVNKKLCQITGYSEAELLRMNFQQLSPVDKQQQDWNFYQSVAQGVSENTIIEKIYIRKDGSTAWVRVNIGLIQSESGRVEKTISVIEDISHRKRAEDALRLHGAALESAANAVLITNAEGIIEWVNPAFTRSTGYSLAEVLGKTPRLLRSGEQDESFYNALWTTLLNGKIWHGELVNLKKDGKKYIDETVITPLKDERGKITHFIAIKQDITSRKKLESDFLQAQKMEAVGKLAGGVAHDFNNNLSVILGGCELLKDNLKEHPEFLEELLEIEKAAERSADLTRQLLAFSRRQLIAPTEINLNQLIIDSEKMLNRILGEDILLKTDLQTDLPNIKADIGNLNQVVMNLAVNARDAMPNGGTITIQTKTFYLDHAATFKNNTLSPGSYVLMSVTDTGCGMTDETVSQIFEPFFTTKGKFGTGLGLAVIYGIVKQHCGWIGVTSKVGGGSCFEIYLPVPKETGRHNEAAIKANGAFPNITKTARILLIEDEAALARLAQRSLVRAGYEVFLAQSAGQAKSIFEAEQGKFDVLFTDVVLPDGNGFDLAEEFRARNPDLTVLITSGYTDERSRWGDSAARNYKFLPKPYQTHEMLENINSLL